MRRTRERRRRGAGPARSRFHRRRRRRRPPTNPYSPAGDVRLRDSGRLVRLFLFPYGQFGLTGKCFCNSGHASRLSVVPDGPGKYVFKVQSTGSCVGQTSEGIVTLYVDCNLAPVPDASVSYRPDNLLDLELGGRYAAPPPAPPPLPPPPPELPPLPPPLLAGFVDPGESTAAPPAPVTVYEPIEPYPATKNLASVPRCFDKVILDGELSTDPNENRAFIDDGEGGDTFTYT